MVKHPWPLLETSLSDFRGLATLNINTYLPTFYEIELAYLSNAVLIKTEEICRNASIFSALGYQANIDASGTVL